MQTLIWIIVAIIVIAVVVAIVMAARRRRHHQLTERATELRTQASERDTDVAEERRRAAEAEAQAQLARAEAERAEEQARMARQSSMYEEARQEDTLREADRIDPRVDGTAGTAGTYTGARGDGVVDRSDRVDDGRTGLTTDGRTEAPVDETGGTHRRMEP
ncbi:hypothetical protein JCM18899A_01680 [Nocardioides sp. AN3]